MDEQQGIYAVYFKGNVGKLFSFGCNVVSLNVSSGSAPLMANETSI